MKMAFPNSRTSRTLGELASDMNSLVDTFLGAANGTDSPSQTTPTQTEFTPRMDIQETDDKFTVSLDLPGVKRSDISIELNEEDLVIHGARVTVAEKKDDRYHRLERWSGEFRRSLRLPRSVHREQISADYHDGVLSVSLPKSKAAASRKIEIRSGETTEHSQPS